MKPAVRYIIRAVKYFCWFAILFTLIISVLAFTKFVPTENGVEGLFIHGWKSILEICGVFLVFSALYPKFGYQKRQVSIPGEWSEVSAEVKGYFADRGDYRLESETPEKLCFRASRAGLRIARMWRIASPSPHLSEVLSSKDRRRTWHASPLTWNINYGANKKRFTGRIKSGLPRWTS